jgi:hypothetical protein
LCLLGTKNIHVEQVRVSQGASLMNKLELVLLSLVMIFLLGIAVVVDLLVLEDRTILCRTASGSTTTTAGEQ